jgi:hypothetical protein
MNEPKTPNLGLNKIDRSSPSTTYFDLDKYLDQNWEKIDEGVATKEELEELRKAVGEIDVPDASLTQKGKVQLSNAVDSEMEDRAATPKAVKVAMNEALLAKQLGVEQKANVVAALNSIGVSASTAESWDSLITKMANIIRATGTATAAQVLSGYTFSNTAGNGLNGGMSNRGAGGTVTPGISDQTKAEGYYSSPIKIKGDPSLQGNIILQGNSIFGVSGTFVPSQIKDLRGTFGKSGLTNGISYDSLISDIPNNKYTLITDPNCFTLLATSGNYSGDSSQSYLCLVDGSGKWASLEPNAHAAYSGGQSQTFRYITLIAIDTVNKRFKTNMFKQEDRTIILGSWSSIPSDFNMNTLRLIHRAYVLGMNGNNANSSITFSDSWIMSF